MSTEDLFRAFQSFLAQQQSTTPPGVHPPPPPTGTPPGSGGGSGSLMQGTPSTIPPMPTRVAPPIRIAPRHSVTAEEVEHQAPQAATEKALPKMGKPTGPKLIHGKDAKFPPDEHQESKTKYFYLPTSVTGKEARIYSGYMCAEAAFLRGVDWTHCDIRCFRRLESAISYYFSQHSHCWTVVIEK